MVNQRWALIAGLVIGTMCVAKDKGFCPSAPYANLTANKKATAPPSSDQDKEYFGTVTLLTVISDKGYVCSTHVLHGISKEINKKTETMVRGWHLNPPRKDGRPVPVLVSIDVNYWTTPSGKIVSDPPVPQTSLSEMPIR